MRIVLTGGPASGKSTIINRIMEEFEGVKLIPEVATSIFTYYKVAPPSDTSSMDFWKWLWSVQKLISMHQVSLEEHIFDTSTPHRLDEFVVVDRGLYDNVAYIRRIPYEIQERLYAEEGDKYKPIMNIHHAISRIQKLAEGRHHFYDLVVILKTTAHDKDLYEKLKASNPARYETAEEAFEIEEKIVESYLVAKKMGLVGEVEYINTLDLDKKIETTMEVIRDAYNQFISDRKNLLDKYHMKNVER